MGTLNSSNDVFLIYIKRLGLIVILMAIMHAVTRNFFQLTFLHYAVLYSSFAVLSVSIYRHNTRLHSILLYGLFGLGLAFVRTSDLIGYTGSRIWGFLLIFSIGLAIVLLTLGLDVFFNRRRVN
jgi:hypothetical protein